MKLSLVLLLITFTFISTHSKIDKLISSGILKKKKNELKIIGNLLFDAKYEPAFIAGILSNIYHGEEIGKFESSNYDSNPDEKPEYLKKMDENHKYGTKYSGKLITDIVLPDLETLLTKLEKKKWNEGQFGLGSLQWRGQRTFTLYRLYNSECGQCTKITKGQAILSEGNMIINEFKEQTYSKIYNQWKKDHSVLDAPLAANDAAYVITKDYVKLEKNLEKEAKIRQTTASNMYNAMNSE